MLFRSNAYAGWDRRKATLPRQFKQMASTSIQSARRKWCFNAGILLARFTPPPLLCFSSLTFVSQSKNLYRMTHQFFISSQTIFLLVFNLTDFRMSELKYWRDSIFLCHANQAASLQNKPIILLVGNDPPNQARVELIFLIRLEPDWMTLDAQRNFWRL
mgnify:FL=1